MGLLARVLRPSGPTHGRPPCSFLPSLGYVVPMVPKLGMPPLSSQNRSTESTPPPLAILPGLLNSHPQLL
jgi:hypothetical protein